MKLHRCLTYGVFFLLFAPGSAQTGYLKDWRETRIVVDIAESATINLGAVGEQIRQEITEILAQARVGPTVKTQSHGYLYLKLIADVVPGQQYYGILEVRVVRPVVVVGIGKVAVAAIWEEAITLAGPVADFAKDLRAGLRKVLVKLKEDWRQDNGASP